MWDGSPIFNPRTPPAFPSPPYPLEPGLLYYISYLGKHAFSEEYVLCRNRIIFLNRLIC